MIYGLLGIVIIVLIVLLIRKHHIDLTAEFEEKNKIQNEVNKEIKNKHLLPFLIIQENTKKYNIKAQKILFCKKIKK